MCDAHTRKRFCVFYFCCCCCCKNCIHMIQFLNITISILRMFYHEILHSQWETKLNNDCDYEIQVHFFCAYWIFFYCLAFAKLEKQDTFFGYIKTICQKLSHFRSMANAPVTYYELISTFNANWLSHNWFTFFFMSTDNILEFYVQWLLIPFKKTTKWVWEQQQVK